MGGGFCCGHCGEDGGHVLVESSGCRLGAGGCGAPAVTWRSGGPIWSAAIGQGGAGLRSSPSGLCWAGVLQCVRLCGLASAGGNSSRGLHSGAGGGGPGFPGVCAGGVCGPLGGVGMPWGVGLDAVGVCGLPGVGGGEGCLGGGSVVGVCYWLGAWGRPVSRARGARDGGRVWAAGLVAGGEGQGRGLCGGLCCVGVCVRLQRCACVVSCRPGGLEEKLAVFCGRGKDSADEHVYLVHVLVSGGERVR